MLGIELVDIAIDGDSNLGAKTLRPLGLSHFNCRRFHVTALEVDVSQRHDPVLGGLSSTTGRDPPSELRGLAHRTVHIKHALQALVRPHDDSEAVANCLFTIDVQATPASLSVDAACHLMVFKLNYLIGELAVENGQRIVDVRHLYCLRF